MKYFIFVAILESILSIGCGQTIPSFLCDGVPKDEFVRNVTDCKTWIKCKEAGPITGLCPGSFPFFDEFNQICTTEDKADCFSCPDPTQFLALYAVENSCNRYVRCLRGVATEQICDEGLLFNNVTRQCELEAGVQCSVSDVLRCPKTIQAGNFYAVNNSTNCAIGLVCVGDTDPITITCSRGLHFNAKTLMCGLPANSGCTDGISTINPNPPTVAPTTSTTTTTTTPNPEAPPGVQSIYYLSRSRAV